MKTISDSSYWQMLALAPLGTTMAAQTAAPPQTQGNNPTTTSAPAAPPMAPAPPGLGHGAFPVKVIRPLGLQQAEAG